MTKVEASPVAFFDLDRTILSINSASRWIQYEFTRGRIGLKEVFRAGAWVIRYHLGEEIQGALRDAIKTLEGEFEYILRQRTHHFYYNHVQGKERRGALAALESHRHRGHRIVLLTSASTYLAEVVAENFKLDGFLCTQFEVDHLGCFTGRPQEPLCYGFGKLDLARTYLQAEGGSLEDAYFYTDSMSDIDMLSAVGHPIVVNPDPRLKGRAKSNGWPVVDWGKPL